MNARIRTGARTLAGLTAACLAMLTPTASRAADVSTSPGKVAVYETRDYWNKQVTVTTIDGQILKAKPKQVLVITADAHTRLSAPNQQALSMYARPPIKLLLKPNPHARRNPYVKIPARKR